MLTILVYLSAFALGSVPAMWACVENPEAPRLVRTHGRARGGSLKIDRLAVVLIVWMTLASAPGAWALVPGGGPKKTDCFAEWQVTSPSVTGTRGEKVDCKDGDTTCDADGTQNGSCTLGVSICVFQTLEGCTPATVTAIDKIKVLPKSRASGITPPVPPSLPASSPVCGAASVVTLPLITKRGVQKPSRPITFKMVATAGKKDPDKLIVRCVPGGAACPANPQGGPSQLVLQTILAGVGGDFDYGWLGISHNFPIVGSSILSFCLTGCDATSNTNCDGVGETGQNTHNGPTFGAPQPLLTAGTPVCVVTRFAGDITAKADFKTGVIDASVPLLSDVYITGNTARNGKGQVCPQCSGNAVGDLGTCIGGRNDGQVCRVDGTTTVADSTGNKDYRLSASCSPFGSPIATLTINLTPFRTGTATGGSCPGQVKDDDCGGGSCNSTTCTGNACVAMVADPTNPSGPMVCQDHKGGISQLCCSTDTTKPCYPTKNGGQISRTGFGAPAVPDGATPFPATSQCVLASVFCEPKTNNGILDDFTTGLPGPGALLQPMTGTWLSDRTCSADTDCDDGNVCTHDTCDALTGCVHTPVADSTPCSDGNPPCNGADTCTAGSCTPGTALACDDANPCTDDTCAPTIGCLHTAVTNGTPCSDGNPCTTDQCSRGRCISQMVGGFAGAACDLDSALATPLCASEPVDPALQALVDSKIMNARDLLRKAVDKSTSRRTRKLINRASRGLSTVIRKAARAARKGSISATCRDAIDQLITDLRQTILGLRV